MTDQDIPQLLRFYLACIEAEDRRALSKKLSALHRSLLSPWDDAEPLFSPEASEVDFTASRASDRRMLLGDGPATGTGERRYYGYPVFLDESGFLSPLFFAEVAVEERGDGRFAMRPVTAGEILLNHHVFQRRHAQPEELRAIQEELEGEFGSFADRLRAAFAAIGTEVPDLSPDRLEPYPTDHSARGRWVNRPILFKSERSVYTHHLRRELEAMAKYPRLARAFVETAAGALTGLLKTQTAGGTRGSAIAVPLLPVLPLNDSQEAAARAGLEARLTVVTGPPGTGKSQVVVDLLASCAAAGRPVLFASKNNKAVDVVRERLGRSLEEGDWTLRLGSRQIMDDSRAEMATRLDSLKPGSAPTAPPPKLLHELDEQVSAARQKIADLNTAVELYAVGERTERLSRSFVNPTWVDACLLSGAELDLARIQRLADRAHALATRKAMGFWLAIGRTLWPGLLRRRLRSDFDSLTAPLPDQVRAELLAILREGSRTIGFEELAQASRHLALLALWHSNEETRQSALSKVAALEPAQALSSQLSDLQARRAEMACVQLRAAWTGRLAPRASAVGHALGQYFELSSRLQRARGLEFLPVLDQFKAAVRTIGADFPVWIVTSLSARNALPLEAGLFDLVIIDEASQCDIPSALPLLFRARRALIIGDPQQLRHISTLSVGEEENLAKEHGVGELVANWSYNRRSLYAAAEGAVLEKEGSPQFLAEHYRSHPAIIEFSNRNFYQGQLILRTSLDKLRARHGDEPLGVFWHDVRGVVPTTSRSAANEIEIAAVIDLLEKWRGSGVFLRSELNFGIVTPFRLQMERIGSALRDRSWWDEVKDRVTVGTAHRFQGDERDVMIFSPVVAPGMPQRLVRWVADTDQLLNVAITRARGALHVVGDLRACEAAGGHLGGLAAAVGQNSGSHVPLANFESPAEARLAELLTEAGLWYAPQHELGRHRLDFLVVSPLGTRYDLEVDGRGHSTDQAVLSDDVRDATIGSLGFKVMRIEARRIFRDEDATRTLLKRLV